jgi:hypothetical protein
MKLNREARRRMRAMKRKGIEISDTTQIFGPEGSFRGERAGNRQYPLKAMASSLGTRIGSHGISDTDYSE